MSSKKKVSRIPIIALFVLFGNGLYSQDLGAGVSAVYNFQTSGIGAGIRAEIVRGEFSIVPQFTLYPSFNKIHEYYAGVGFHLNIISYGDIFLYGLANGSYNGWINHENSLMEKARYSNWDAEIGAGIKKGKCIRPFMELRYNFKWKEANLCLGLMYFFNCNKKGGGKKRAVSCPAYSN
jgi:hypothetical protein